MSQFGAVYHHGQMICLLLRGLQLFLVLSLFFMLDNEQIELAQQLTLIRFVDSCKLNWESILQRIDHVVLL